MTEENITRAKRSTITDQEALAFHARGRPALPVLI